MRLYDDDDRATRDERSSRCELGGGRFAGSVAIVE